MRKALGLWMVFLLCFVASGCGPKLPPNTSPEGAAAIKGRAVVNAARAALPTIDSEMTAGRLPKQYGVPILEAVREVFVQNVNLADGLAIIDQAKTAAEAKTGKDKANAAILAIDAALTAATSPIKDPAVKASVSQLLLNLVAAINAVKELVSPAADAPHIAPTPERLVIQAALGDSLLGGLNQTNLILLAFGAIAAAIAKMKKAWKDAHPDASETENPLRDDVLIALLKQDAQSGIAEVDAILAKHRTEG